MAAVASIQELWVHPVKGCRGISLPTAKLTRTGLEFDRAWCIVDEDGVVSYPLQTLSQRQVPRLSTITVAFSDDKTVLTLSAPGMPDIAVPTDVNAYMKEESIRVESAGWKPGGDGWSWGFIEAKTHAAASDWVTKYLNTEFKETRLVSGHTKPSRFLLCRSLMGMELTDYEPIIPLIQKIDEDPKYKERFANNARHFADFAPLLLVNKASMRFVGERCMPDGQAYPTKPFRGNIVVDGPAGPWAEETWGEVNIVSQRSKKPVFLRKIKDCPRCNVPCRDGENGDWIFPTTTNMLGKVLMEAFPQKAKDPEWGTYASCFFGVYYGNGGQEGMISVGDTVEVLKKVRWDDHLGWQISNCTAWGLGALATSAAVGLAAFAWVRLTKSR